MPESTQHKLDRVRRPRVQITYDVETLGSIVQTELPFVVGIMADLSGNAVSNNENKTLLKDRKFVEIDRDNFDTIMEKLSPALTVKGDALTFTKLEDFDPINVLRQKPHLKLKFESRTRLSNLVAKLDGNVALQRQFIEEFNTLKNDAPTTLLLDKYYDALYPTVKPTAWVPTVTSATAKINTLSTPIIIGRNEADSLSEEVTRFKITEITDGHLFKNDGTTEIAGDSFISFDEGKAGLKFKPTGNKGGSFKVFASLAADNTLSTEGTTATIYPFAKPDVTVKASEDGKLFTVTIKPNKAETATVHNFKITEIKGGVLTKSDDAALPATPITVVEGSAGLKFKLGDGSTSGSFTVQSAASAVGTDPVGEPKTVTIPHKPVGGRR
jgi:type VI secretion system protein ImpB